MLARVPRFVYYLLQRGVRDAVAGQAQVTHGQVERLEEQSKGPVSGSTVGQNVGDLLTDALQKNSFRDVAAHKLTHDCHVCWLNSHKVTHNASSEETGERTSPMERAPLLIMKKQHVKVSTFQIKPVLVPDKLRQKFGYCCVTYWEHNTPHTVTFKHTETHQWT